MKYKFKITVNDLEMGIYEAETESEALQMYAEEAGYENFNCEVMI